LQLASVRFRQSTDNISGILPKIKSLRHGSSGRAFWPIVRRRQPAAAGFFNIFNWRERRRTYRCFSVAMAALRAAFAATAGSDRPAVSVDRAAAVLVTRTRRRRL